MIIGFDGSRSFVKRRTGTENYSYQLLKSLAKIDRRNQYMVYVRPTSVKYGMTNEKWPKNFQFKEIGWPRFWTQGGLGLQTFKDKLDVLFVPAHTLPIIKKPGLKTVVTVHDLGSQYLPQMHQFKQRAYLGFMQKYQLKTASKIIAVSNATKMDLINKFESSAFKRSFQASLIKKIGINPKKISVVYEGYDKDMFRPISSRGRSNGSYFLFVGTIQPRKNLERLIIAFSNLKNNSKLVIAGSKGWLSDQIYKLPQELGIGGKVEFLGYVPDEKLPDLYSGAIALVFPSLFEGFGLPILEAQACGTPVITSNLSSMPEISGKGAILVNPYSVDEIAHAMIRVKGEGERVKLVKAGFENVKRFSWEKCSEETLKVLESI